MAFRPIVGLEVHAQLLTRSKMFCTCPVQFGSEPNSNCCPVCTGMPGSLPVPNRKAAELVIRTGLALGCQVGEYCRFYRKNYFYPDVGKNFQITQYHEPLTYDGRMDLSVDGAPFSVRIRRAHLEEDTGKNIHLSDGRSLLEYNRSGVPLMEIVTEPDFTTADQVREYLVQLRRLLRYLEVSTANMEEGAMRCEPTVNLVDREQGRATPKVEIKNLASFRVVHEAVRYEIERQYWCIENNAPMQQETRRWNETEAKTTVMRAKESAADYMYFPEPDLPPLTPDRQWVEQISDGLPELPLARQERFVTQYGLPQYDAEVLTEDRTMADYFEAVTEACHDSKSASNWVMGDFTYMLHQNGIGPSECKLEPCNLAKLINLVADGTISTKIAKDIFPRLYADNCDPAQLIQELDLAQISDQDELLALVDAAIDANPKAAEDFRNGKDKALAAMVGHVMKATRGQANPRMVNTLLRERLG
jgi:aspartyl-tRNA(Asn)/glutamyl-tRNA(Gln) amidotransferase subunit B